MADVKLPELMKAQTGAAQYMSDYTKDMDGFNKHFAVDNQVAARDKYMQMAQQRQQGANNVQSAGGVLDKYNNDAGNTMNMAQQQAVDKSGRIADEVDVHQQRRDMSDDIIAKAAMKDAVDDRTLKLTKNQIDANEALAKKNAWGAVLSGGLYAGAAGTKKGEDGTSMWDNMGSFFSSDGNGTGGGSSVNGGGKSGGSKKMSAGWG